ncbi:MAG: GTP-binding protein [Candidatus Thorarchaeota archaeon]
MTDIKREFVFKVVLMGEGSVGKTSIRSKFMGVGFKSEYIKTIGADFASKAIVLGENKVHFQIWDLAGQNMYKHVRSSFYSGCKCGFLVFDLTAPDTLEKLETWVEEAIEHSGGFLKIFIILGNKHDLKDQLKVKPEDVELLLEKIRQQKDIEADYIHTSALTGENINEAFEKMGKMFLEKEGFPREGAEELEFYQEIDNTKEFSEAPETDDLVYEEEYGVSENTLPGTLQETIDMLNDKISRLTEILLSLEERILLIETKKDYSQDIQEITDLKEKIENLDKEVSMFSEISDINQSTNSQQDNLDFLIPLPTIDEITPTENDDEYEKLDRTSLKTMEVIDENNDVDSIAQILSETEEQTIKTNSKENKGDLSKDQLRCPKCGSKLSFIKQYNRWYCYRCKLYC